MRIRTMDYDKMEAGEEMDNLVAEKVMGWRRMSWKDYHAQEQAAGRMRNDPPDDRDEFTYEWHDAEGKMTGCRAEFCDDFYNPEEAWSPSKIIGEAWMLFSHEWVCTPRVERTSRIEEEWECEYGWHTSMREDGCGTCDHSAYAKAPTAPLAICRAALKASAAGLNAKRT